ncbi:MAG TPA: hypothetical protein VGF75_02940 [Candidatus Saccharimonadales bacterium]
MPGILTLPISAPPKINFLEIKTNGVEGFKSNVTTKAIINKPPVDIDTQFELLTIIIKEVEAEVSLTSEVSEAAEQIFANVPSSIDIGLTVELIVSGLPVYLITTTITLTRFSINFGINEGRTFLTARFNGSTSFVADLTNAVLILTGQQAMLQCTASLSTGLLTEKIFYNKIESEKEVEKKVETKAHTGAITVVVGEGIGVFREVSTLPEHEHETAPPRRVV